MTGTTTRYVYLVRFGELRSGGGRSPGPNWCPWSARAPGSKTASWSSATTSMLPDRTSPATSTASLRQVAGMKSRTDAMWWGTAIEAPDPSGLARFYAELLGWHVDWHVGHEEPGTAIVPASPQGPFFVFQQAEGYRAPVRPPVDGEQRPMMRFDFQVDDLDTAFAEAVAPGRHDGRGPAAGQRPSAPRPRRPPLLPLPRRGMTRSSTRRTLHNS